MTFSSALVSPTRSILDDPDNITACMTRARIYVRQKAFLSMQFNGV